MSMQTSVLITYTQVKATNTELCRTYGYYFKHFIWRVVYI